MGLSDTVDTPAELIPLVKEFGFEGVIAKRRDSCCEIGKRSGTSLKYKATKAQAFVIGDYTECDKLMFASKVRNWFVPRLRREVWAS